MRNQFLVILVCAFAIRMLGIVAAGSWAHPLHAEPTEEVRIAQHLVAGHGFATPNVDVTSANLSPSAFSPPAYPYFLAGLIRVCRFASADAMLPYRLALIISAAAGAAAVGCLALAARNFAGRRGFWTVGALAAIWPVLVTQSGIIWDTPFALLALGIACWLATRGPSHAQVSGRHSLLLGLFLGITVLFNPIVALFVGAAIVAFVVRESVRWRSSLLVAGVMCLCCVAPWFIRNFIVFHRFIPVRNTFGLTLWLGNLPDSDGTARFATGYVPMTYPPENKLLVELGEDRYMQLKSRQALKLIENDPRHFMKLTFRRIEMFWFGELNRPTVFLGRRFPMILGMNLLKLALNATLLCLALGGLVCCVPRLARIAFGFGILAMSAPFYVTHVGPNYRAYVDPLLCLLAGVFVVQMIGHIRTADESMGAAAIAGKMRAKDSCPV